MKSQLPKIAFGPGEVAGYFSRLSTGFDELLVTNTHYLLAPDHFAYSTKHYPGRTLYQLALYCKKHRNKLLKAFGFGLEILGRIESFTHAVLTKDTFIFFGMSTFWGFQELALLKILRKRIVFVYLGSDARPPYLSGRYLDDNLNSIPMKSLAKETERIKNRIRLVENYADYVINHTATSQLFSKPSIRLSDIGLPIPEDLGLKEPPPEKDRGSPSKSIKIVHAPTRPKAKGTPLVNDLINKLRSRGLDIEYTELIGKSNSEVLSHLSNCDFVIDELYSDVPLATLATEAACFGKPAITGGYYAKDYFEDNPNTRFAEGLFIQPDELEATVESLIADSRQFADASLSNFSYVNSEWRSHKVAEKFLILLNGDAPAQWVFDPKSVSYIWGWGLSKNLWIEQVGQFVDECGANSLGLQHNPQLEQLLLSTLNSLRNRNAKAVS
jgi:hypothetical protein